MLAAHRLALLAVEDEHAALAQYRAGLDILAQAPFSETLNLLISGVPDIYWLWNAKRTSLYCRLIAWPFVPCQNLLANAADDCASSTSREDPDTVYPGDGPNCQRRKAFHARIRDDYNTVLSGDLTAGNAYHVVTGADDVVIDGFTITKGYADEAGANDR